MLLRGTLQYALNAAAQHAAVHKGPVLGVLCWQHTSSTLRSIRPIDRVRLCGVFGMSRLGGDRSFGLNGRGCSLHT
eukprot:3514732-Heterocapsa_arctica.AAC.1